MAYIGNTPAENYASFLTETFTVSATASYTLSHAVSNENDIRLVINGVVQQPGSGKAYTASGTTLTLTSATVSGDVMYAVYLGRALQTVNPPNASVGSAQIADSLISGKTALGATPADTDELLISDAGTLKRVDYSYLKSANTPAFSAHMAADQSSLTDNTWVKLTMETEFFDSDSKYNTSNQRFTPTVAGKYMFGASVYIDSGNTMETTSLAFYKNGSRLLYKDEEDNDHTSNQLTGIIELDTDDYVELYAKVNVSSSGTFRINMDGTTADNRTYWYGYKIIGA